MEPNVGLDEHSVGSMVASARAEVYAILSACFAPPTAGLLEVAQSGALAEALAESLAKLRDEGSQLEAALRAFEALAGELVHSGSYGTMEALEVEYTRLFLGPGLPAIAPYESVHVDREEPDVVGQLWGQTTFAVSNAYRQAGLAPHPGPEPPDHLAAELEFVAMLSQREATMLTDGQLGEAEAVRQQRASFLTEHLRRWGPEVTKRVAEEARHPLYGAAAGLLQAMLAADA